MPGHLAAAPKTRNPAGTAADRKESGRPKATKKQAPATIDDVLDDIDSKIALVKGTSPAETTKKMNETIASDGSLSDSEKKP